MSDELPIVEGRRLDGTLEEFVRSCRVLLAEEQRRVAPNNALVSLLCDGVRLAREYDETMTRKRSEL